MSVYRVNLYNTFDNVLKRKAFSVPSSDHTLYKELSDVSQWQMLEEIQKGNVLLLCRGIRLIWAIAYATDDCKFTDIDAFKQNLRYEEKGFRYISLDIYREFNAPIDGVKFFGNLLTNKPFEDTYFCTKLDYIPEKKDDFTRAMNKLLEV